RTILREKNYFTLLKVTESIPGGLTRGRGISDSVLAKWICGSPGSSAICSSLEEFAGVVFLSGEQHVDFRWWESKGYDKTGIVS
ncbi:hypothetical protein ACUWC2_28890, partial [Klebsiella pneumoniae]|uniref:hypothetical protein n=1 Tax=Klebsiella pneumoniae TaxID=573 RepID=UPI00405578C2